MSNKKTFILLILIILGIGVGFIFSLINNFVWYIFIFTLISGMGIGFIYNRILIYFSFSSKDRVFIYIGIGLCTCVTFLSLNIFDYHQVEKEFNQEMVKIQKEIERENQQIDIDNNEVLANNKEILEQSNTIFNDMKKDFSDAFLALYDENKIIIQSIAKEDRTLFIKLNTKLKHIKKDLNNGDYEKVIDDFIDYYSTLESLISAEEYAEIISLFTTYQETFKESKDTVQAIQESIETTQQQMEENNKVREENKEFYQSGDFFETQLKEETGFGGYVGFQLLTIKSGGSISNDSGGILETGSMGEIAFILIDIIAFIYGMISVLTIFGLRICTLHNKCFKKSGNSYTFPTTLKDLNSLELEESLNQMNTISEKGKFFSKKATYYVSVYFLRCPECGNESSENIIDIAFDHHGKSKKRPITGVKTISYSISKEEYNQVSTRLEELSKSEPRIV